MKITDLLSVNTVSLDSQASTKEEVINAAIELLSKENAISDMEVFKAGILAREAKSSTAIGEGIAIPHCKDNVVKKPSLAAMVLKNGVDYDSIDGEPVNLLFMIAAPNTEDNVHLDVLARLSNLLMDESFKDNLLKATTVEEFLKVIDEAEGVKLEEEAAPVESGFPRVLAVTACPTGIAHTYMAEQGLKDAGAKMGVSIKVETNGSGGAKNVLTKEEIEHAEGIIVAADVKVEMERFAGKRVVIVPVAKGIHEAEALINKALSGEAPVYTGSGEKTESSSGEKESIGRQIYKHLMSGISHMLPFVIGGGILIALAFLIDGIAGVPQDGNFGTGTPVSWFFKSIGGYAFGFMLPVLAGFIAYSIAGKPGLAVGFVGGYLATVNFSIGQVIENAVNGDAATDLGTSGFLGALAAGFLAGYIVKLLQLATKRLPRSLEGIKPTLIYPLFGILLIGTAMFLLNTPFSYVNMGLNNGLMAIHKAGLTLLLGALLAGMMAIDMGGPINKAAYVFGSGFCLSAAQKAGFNTAEAAPYLQLMAAVMIGGMVPPIGIALSANLFPQKYSKRQRGEAPVNYIMGLGFITEGAIPYAAEDPARVIPSCVVGSLTAGLLSTLMGCTLAAPHGGIFVFAVVGNWYWYLIALAIGSVVTALMLGILKKDNPNPELGKWKGINVKALIAKFKKNN